MRVALTLLRQEVSQSASSRLGKTIEDPASLLRIRVGSDAEMILDTWKALSDSDFEAAMRATLSLDW